MMPDMELESPAQRKERHAREDATDWAALQEAWAQYPVPKIDLPDSFADCLPFLLQYAPIRGPYETKKETVQALKGMPALVVHNHRLVANHEILHEIHCLLVKPNTIRKARRLRRCSGYYCFQKIAGALVAMHWHREIFDGVYCWKAPAGFRLEEILTRTIGNA